MSSYGISVVTTTWNEHSTIENLILKTKTVLQTVAHEIIVVDDESLDGTIEIARPIADIAVTKKREGQTKGLLHGMRLAKYPVIITIDADLENNPEHIPEIAQKASEYDIVVASRTKIPRISEKIASKTLGKLIGIKDCFSNYRAYRKGVVPLFNLKGRETFGAELLVIAKKHKLKIGEIEYAPPPRRSNPRIGGAIKANLRISFALLKTLAIQLANQLTASKWKTKNSKKELRSTFSSGPELDFSAFKQPPKITGRQISLRMTPLNLLNVSRNP